ncbi:MAG: LysM peptidoglycan-binding domain-containing protein [Actinomycetota bacterium]|nr:LysM peptidoglycan-binding domain-containing protein [Actinomycetota bacterium]
MQVTGFRPLSGDAAMAFLILGLGCFLTVTGTGLVERWQRSALKRQSLSFEDLLGVAAVAAGLLIVLWWMLSFTAALAAAMFERTGRRRAAAVSGQFSPAFMRRLALAILGVQLMGAPLAHAHNQPAPGGPGNGTVAVAAAWTPTEGISGPEPPRRPTREGNPDVAPPTASPVQQLPGLSGLQPQWQPSPPAAALGPVVSAPLRAAREQQAGHELVVRSGDTLWTIAAGHLGPEASDVDIALEWPRWFENNRAIIGSNPNTLLPGQILKAP